MARRLTPRIWDQAAGHCHEDRGRSEGKDVSAVFHERIIRIHSHQVENYPGSVLPHSPVVVMVETTDRRAPITN